MHGLCLSVCMSTCLSLHAENENCLDFAPAFTKPFSYTPSLLLCHYIATRDNKGKPLSS